MNWVVDNMADLSLLLEAEKRGILPKDKQLLLDEARARNLIPPLDETDKKTSESLKEFGRKAAYPVKEAISGTVGMIGDINELAKAGKSKAMELFGVDTTQPQSTASFVTEQAAKFSPQGLVAELAKRYAPTSADVREKLSFVPTQRAESLLGRTGQDVARNVLMMPTAAARMPAIASGLGENIAGAVTGEDPFSRAAGSIIAPLALTPSALRSPTIKDINLSLSKTTPAQMQQARDITRQSFARGVPVTAAESLSYATGSESLPKIQRRMEQAQGVSGETMRDFMAQRGAQAQQAVEQAVPSFDRPMLQTDIQRAAEAATFAAGQKVRDVGDVAFSQIRNVEIPDKEFFKLTNDPLIGDAFETVANSKLWQRRVGNNSPKSIQYLDAVRQELEDQRQAFIRAGNANKAGVLGDAIRELKSAAPSGWQEALTKVSGARKEFLTPLETMPISTMAESNLPKQMESLFTSTPAELNLTPSKVKSTIIDLGKQDPNLPKDFTANYLRGMIDKSKPLASKDQSRFGTKFADSLMSNRTQEQNLKTAMVESFGPDTWTGFNNLLTYFKAQGKRLQPGSMTAEETLARGRTGAIRTALKNPLEAAGGMYENIFYANDSANVAKALTSPEGVDLLNKLAAVGKNDKQAALLVTELQRILQEQNEQGK